MKLQARNRSAVVCYSLLVWVAVTFRRVHCQADNAQKFCLGGKEDSPPVNVTLKCGAGKVISLGEVLLGRNVYGLCTIIDGDCVDTTDVLNKCEKQESCTVTLDKAYTPECGYATFLKVSYDCQTAFITRPTSAVNPTTARPDKTGGSIDTGGGAQSTIAEGKKSEDNTGLIVGCVVAVVITIVLLIVAIVLVVRRLACAAENGEDDEEKKSSGCHILPCVTLAPSTDGSKASQDNDDDSNGSPGGSDDKRAKRKRKHRGRRADKNQNMSTRLAPVGQEDEEGTSSKAEAPARHSHTSFGEGSVPSATETGGASTKTGAGRGGGGRGGGGRPADDDGAKGAVAKNKSGAGDAATFAKDSVPATVSDAPRSKTARPAKTAADAVGKGKSAPKQAKQFDAVAVPNTETTTSC